MLESIFHILLLLLGPPLLLGVIGKTKAAVAGRTGPPLLQPYWDLLRLLRKGAVYSKTTTWVFRAGPTVSWAAVFCAGLLLPLVSGRSPLGFSGDVILFAYLLALGRFFTVAAALDTGSSFEGMGASREAAFSALAEPALFLSLAVLCVPGRTISFEETFGSLSWESWGPGQPAFWAVLMALFLILLAENSRISVDDPNTHLELTMIHEVMVLDHGGPDLAFILHGSAVKLFLFAGLLVHALVPIPESADGWGLFLFVSGEIGFAVLIGMVESVTARLRLPRVPQFLVVLSVIASIGLATVFYRGLP